MPAASFDEVLKTVWRQALVENADVVKIGVERYPVIRSKAKRLRQVEFDFDGNTIMGIEQNPKTNSRWAQMARAGKKVMQFIQDGRYVALLRRYCMVISTSRGLARLRVRASLFTGAVVLSGKSQRAMEQRTCRST